MPQPSHQPARPVVLVAVLVLVVLVLVVLVPVVLVPVVLVPVVLVPVVLVLVGPVVAAVLARRVTCHGCRSPATSCRWCTQSWA